VLRDVRRDGIVMRGFRCVGMVRDLNTHVLDPPGLVAFGPFADGTQLRGGFRRVRDMQNREVWRSYECSTDYVFVATPLGEACFK